VADRHRIGKVLAAAAGLLLVAGCSGQPDTAGPGRIVVHDDDGKHGAVLSEPYVVPDISLTATDGSSFSMTEDTEKPLTLVFFGYTHCPDVCQVVMSDIASAMTRLDAQQREQLGMVFVTTDPARDDPAVLREYLDRFDPGFEGLTGDLQKIVALGKELGVPIEKGARMPSGGYEVGHGTQIVAVDARDRSTIVWTEGTSADHLAEDLDELLDARGGEGS